MSELVHIEVGDVALGARKILINRGIVKRLNGDAWIVGVS